MLLYTEWQKTSEISTPSAVNTYLPKFSCDDHTARIILNMSNDVDHSIALHALGWQPPKAERKKTKTKMMCKVLNAMGPKSLTNLFTYKNGKTNYHFRDIPTGLCLPRPYNNVCLLRLSCSFTTELMS